MEQNKDNTQILDLINQPAFCVINGIVSHVNQAAARSQMCSGTPVSDLLVTGQEEYARFSGGYLYLTVRICDRVSGASVTRHNEMDIFVTEQSVDKGELRALALAAQELRIPLSTLMTVTDDLMPLPCMDSDPTAADLAARINRGLFRMLRIIGNMSDAYRFELEPRPALELRSIGAICEEYFVRSAELLKKSGFTLSYTGLQETVYSLVDEKKLERAMSNILSNAATFAPKGSTIHAKLVRRGTMLYLTVQDDGSGFDEDLRSHVYDRYLREPAIEEGRHGIGLGMVMVRSVATMHGGTVLIEQSKERGTRVTMTMPIRQKRDPLVQSPYFDIDYAGERDPMLVELSDVLVSELYSKEIIN